MTRLIEILISFAIVAALMLLVGIVLPSKRHLSESVETNRKMTIVFDTINSLRRFKDWNPLALRDPKAKFELSGPASGVGAKVSFDSDVQLVGNGSWEITESVPGKSVKYAVDNSQRGHDKTMTFTLKPTGRGAVKRNIEISQAYDVDYGWNLIGRYAGLYVKRHVGDDMKLGLSRLTNMLATVPNFDYNVEGSGMRGMQVVDRPAEDLLVVKAGAIERNNDVIKASMKSNLEWINRTMAANGLVVAGPLRIISTELGRDTYTFDLAQPVKKAAPGEKTKTDFDKVKEAADKGGDKAAADKDKPEADATATPAPVVDALTPTVAAGAPMTVKIPDGAPVEYVQTKAGKAAVAYFTGFLAGLDNVRNALRAWALTQGHEVIDRPYEIYKSGIDKAFPEVGKPDAVGGEYEVFWTLKSDAPGAAGAPPPAPVPTQ